MNHPKVLIIGAGAAGIAAASRLVSNKIYNFSILEAEDRVGGRIFTTEFGDATVELGAQWVHGETNNVVHTLGTSANLIKDNVFDIYKSSSVLSDGTFLDNEAVWKLFSVFKDILHDEDKISNFNGSLGDYFKLNLTEILKSERIDGLDANLLNSCTEWLHKFQNSIDGSDSWFNTSASGTLEYHECEGNSLTTWKTGGYANIFNLLMGNNSELIKEKIIFKKTVKRIAWGSQPVEVLCEDGQTFIADHVLVTISLGVLKENMTSLFVPSLPQKKLKAIQGLGIGTVAKIFLKFPYRWWPADCNGFNFIWKDSDYTTKIEGDAGWLPEVFGFYSVDDRPTVLCGWVVGTAARLMEQYSDQQVQDGCHQLLTQFLGNKYTIPAPERVLRSCWHSNPHFRGSYSFRSVSSDELKVSAADLAAPLNTPSGVPVVLFGGEATHDHYYSTVHGAIETGWREADRLTALFAEKSNRCIQNGEVESTHFYSVIIVGAGMAGLGAAKTLLEAGIDNFIILEGQEQAGGRVWSVHIDDSSRRVVELGAQWIHGDNNPVYQLAASHQMLSDINSDEGQGLYLKPDGREIPFTIVQEVAGVVGSLLEECCTFVNQPEAPESVGHYLMQNFIKYLDSCNDPPYIRKDKIDLYDWHVRFQVIDNSCDQLSCLSAKAWGLYEYCGGIDYNNLKHGYSSLVQCLTEKLPAGSLRTCTEAMSIKLSSENAVQATVLCEDGTVLLTDHVIVTSSLGYLKENKHRMFEPSLPSDIERAIDCMGFDTINKLFLIYSSAWWPKDLQGIQLIWDTEETTDLDHQSWLRHMSGFDVVATMEGVLLGWVGGEGAVTMETLSDDRVARDCTAALCRFMQRTDIPPPNNIIRSKWNSNKFVRGGYSHTTTQCERGNCGPETLSQPIYSSKSSAGKEKHPVMLLAGEAVHKSYFSTTHGAYLSGTAQAQVIVDYLRHSVKS